MVRHVTRNNQYNNELITVENHRYSKPIMGKLRTLECLLLMFLII